MTFPLFVDNCQFTSTCMDEFKFIIIAMWKSKEILAFLLISLSETREKCAFEISHYEYGVPSKGNMLSVIHKEVIPPFVPLHRVNLSSQTAPSKRVTHLIVEYISLISKLSIEFEERESVLVFHIQFPFVPIPFGAVGFSPLFGNVKSPLWKSQYDAYKDGIQQFLVENI